MPGASLLLENQSSLFDISSSDSDKKVRLEERRRNEGCEEDVCFNSRKADK